MKLQNASDAAAVAAASMPEGVSADQRRQVALRYYNLNYPASYLGVARPSPNIQIGDTIIVDATTTLATNFIANVGVQQLESRGRTVVNRATQAGSIYDVMLVMDNSGSMGDSAAAPAYAITPTAERGSARTRILDLCRNEMLPNYQQVLCRNNGYLRRYGNYSNCVLSGPMDYCRAIPDAQNGYSFLGNTRLNALRAVALNFVSRLLDQAESGSRIGVVSYGSEVLVNEPISDNAATIRQTINRMGAFGATNPFAAMKAASDRAADFSPNHIKAVVLLTDGVPTTIGGLQTYSIVNNQSVPRDSEGCDSRSFCNPAVNRTLPICTQLKNSGVQVYTIAFGPEVGSPSVQNFLRSCASVDSKGNPLFYSAPTGAELDQAFQQILASLGRIRISQ